MNERIDVDVYGICTCHHGEYSADVDMEGEYRAATWTSPAERPVPVVGSVYDADNARVDHVCHRLADALQIELDVLTETRNPLTPDQAGLHRCDDCQTFISQDRNRCPVCDLEVTK